MTTAQTRTTRVAVNALTSYLRFAVFLGVMFFLTPFIIRCVGPEEFGLWSLIFAVLGLSGMLDFGFGTGVVKWVAECRNRGGIEYRNRMLSTAAVAYVLISCASALGIAVLAQVFNRLFDIPAAQQGKVPALLWILATRSVLLNLPLGLFRSALFGAQRIYLINGVQACATFLYGLTAWFVLKWGGGLVALAWVNLAAMLGEYLAYVLFSFRTVEGLRLSWSLVDRRLLWEASSFSAYVFLAHAAGLVFARTDPVIVKFSLPLSAVAVYAVALKIAESANLLTKQFIDVLAPLAAELQGGGEDDKLRLLLIKGTKFALAPAMALAVAAWIYGPEAIVFWVGPEFSGAAPVLAVLMGVVVFAVPQMMAANVLMMTGYHRFVAGLVAAGALFHIVLSLALVQPLGLVGVALGALIAFVPVNVALTIHKACRAYRVRPWEYLRRAVVPALLPAVGQLALSSGLKTWVPPTDLVTVGLHALPGAVLYGLCFWRFGVEFHEKQSIIARLVRWRFWRPGALVATKEICP